MEIKKSPNKWKGSRTFSPIREKFMPIISNFMTKGDSRTVPDKLAVLPINIVLYEYTIRT